MRLKPTELILIGTRTIYQATGYICSSCFITRGLLCIEDPNDPRVKLSVVQKYSRVKLFFAAHAFSQPSRVRDHDLGSSVRFVVCFVG